MISITVKNKHHLTNVFSFKKQIKKSIRQALFDIGKDNVTYARNLLSQRKSGRIYFLKTTIHQASAPGEAPANLTGELSRHLDFVVTGNSALEFGDKNQPGKPPYGLHLEFGTKKIKPRPHIKKTVDDRAGNSLSIFKKRTNSVFKLNK